MIDPLNKLCKWRAVLAGWHSGTQAMTADGAPAMRDLMDKWLIARVEANALSVLLIEKGIITAEELTASVCKEAELLDKALEKQFPGFHTTEDGVVIEDIQVAQATMERLRFPP